MNHHIPYAIVILACLLAGVISQSAAQDEVSIVHVPVLNACKDDVVEALRNVPRTSPFVARYVAFDERFPSHAELDGFVVLESFEYDRNTLRRLAGGYVAECFDLPSMAFSKTDEQEPKRLFDFLHHASAGAVRLFDAGVGGSVDPEQLYIVNEPEALRVYFKLE